MVSEWINEYGGDTRLIEEVKERESELSKNAEKILSYFLSL